MSRLVRWKVSFRVWHRVSTGGRNLDLTPSFGAITLAGMFQTYMIAYPWDLIDDDLSTALDHLQGEIGISGLSVWMSTPSMIRLRTRDVNPRVFRTRGGVFFHPNDERYANTRCKPILSSWAKPKDPLAKIAQACDDKGLKLRVVLSASRTGRIAQRQPEMACKNLFGDSSEDSLCLSNPDVQTFLGSLVEDVSSRHALDGISLADFQTVWAETLGPALEMARSLGDTERCLLGLCFCESCQQRADAASVDIAAARDTARDLLETSLSGRRSSEASYDAILEENTALADYQKWRGRELSTLLSHLQAQCGCGLRVDRKISGVERSLQGGMRTGDAGVAICLSADDPISIVPSVAKEGATLLLPSDYAVGSHAQSVVTAFSTAAEVGVESIEIDDYGLLPDTALDTIRQAIRFARRTAGE